MELLAKLEEEEGGQDLTREQLRGVILVLGVVLIDAIGSKIWVKRIHCISKFGRFQIAHKNWGDLNA